MLSLDDPRWHDLWTGYSAPRKFLPALGRLLNDAASAPGVVDEFNMENYVCHQYSVYHTTLAVVPHFVQAAGRLPPADRGELLGTAGFYALLLSAPPPYAPQFRPPPNWLVADYERAVQTALPLIGEALAAPPKSGPDPERSRLLLMAGLAGFHGQWRVGVLLTNVSGWRMCRNCEAEFDALDEWGKGF